MDIAIWSGDSAFHPFQSSQHRSNSKLFISFFYRFHSQIIFAQQVDRTRSPGMAQTLSIWTAIHGKMLRSGFFRVIFFPEGGSAFLQHSTPIGFHFFHYSILFAKSTKGFQFVKTHIGSRYFQNTVIQQNRLFNGLLLIFIQILKEDRKHIRIAGDRITLLTVDAVMHKCLFLIIPEGGF